MNLLTVENLKIHFPVKSGGMFSAEKSVVRAVDGVSFNLKKGTTLGIVGESGCGKSTLVRGIMGLNQVTEGSIELSGKNLLQLNKKEQSDPGKFKRVAKKERGAN